MTKETTIAELTKALYKPFDKEVISYKYAENREKAIYLAKRFSYVDARHYQARLDEVFGVNWSVQYDVKDGVVRCILSAKIADVRVQREDIANIGTDSKASATEAFKRACTAFGIGRHLYLDDEVYGLMENKNNQHRLLWGGDDYLKQNGKYTDADIKDWTKRFASVCYVFGNYGDDIDLWLSGLTRGSLIVVKKKSKKAFDWIGSKIKNKEVYGDLFNEESEGVKEDGNVE